MTGELVLVTGGSGFIAGHCIHRLIERGYRVRTTVRSPGREPELRAGLTTLGREPGSALTIAVADLTADEGWDEAVAGCDYVMHVASPVPHGTPAHEDDVIVPAREGTLRVLRASWRAGVRRVVLTSAFHAIGFGWGRTDHRFTEADWSKLDGPGIDAYGKSKVLAERAAWDFAAEAGDGTELTVTNPVAVLGPVLGSGVSGANALVRRILTGGMPGFPDLWIPIVDVRDVAEAQASALTTAGVAGKRFLLASGTGLRLREMGEVLRRELGEAAGRVPTRSIPNFMIRMGALVNPEFRAVAADLGVVKKISNEQACQLLDWHPRVATETLLDTARSMIDQGMIDPR